MRELKFRVWDKLEKRFIYPDKGYQGHYALTLDGKFYNLQNGSGGDEYTVQQYTELKDLNGVEIYEGDILKCPNTLNISLYGEFSYREVIWKYDSFTWVLNSKRALMEFDVAFGSDGDFVDHSSENLKITVEVVGNIFENPELLK